jgi:oligopeptide transport system substrate-binding protein
MLRRSIFTYGAMIGLTLVASCTKCGGKDSESSSTASTGPKVFSFARTSAFRSLDPVKQFDEASSEMISNIYDTLLEYHYLKRPYELKPSLLETMPQDQGDGLTFLFPIRKGVFFNDDACFEGGKGRELRADDVIFSIKRFADANANVLSYVLMEGFVEGLDAFREQTKKEGKTIDYSKHDVSGLQKVDDYNIKVKFTRKNPLAFYPFAMQQLAIVPAECAIKYGDEFERHPVGSGPFYIKEMSRRGEIILARNPRYWDTYPAEGEAGDEEAGYLKDAGKQLPLVDEVRLPLIEESQPMLLSFQKSEIDIVAVNRDNFSKFVQKVDGELRLKDEWKDRIKLFAIPALSTEYIKFNMKNPIVGGYEPKQKALRQAFAYALNSQAYVDLMLDGRAMVLNSIVPHPIKGSELDIPAEYYKQNIEMAKQKLAEAGYPDGKGLPVIEIEYRDASALIRQQWEFHRAELEKVGIKAKANFQTFSAWLQKTEKGNFQISGAGWMADYPDAENFYQLFYGPNTPPGPNDGSYNNPEYNQLYEQIRFMENGPERYALFAKMNAILKEDAPGIFQYNQMRVGLQHKWVRNFKRNIMYNPPLKYVDVDMTEKAKGF